MKRIIGSFGILAMFCFFAGPAFGQIPQYKLGIKYTITNQGVRVDGVLPKSAASVAGLQTGDVIMSINRKVIRNVQDYFTALQLSRGKAILVVLNKKTKRLAQVEVVLGAGGAGAVGRVPYQLGVQGMFTAFGMRVLKIKAKSPAEKIGIKPGDYIVRIDNQPIRNQLGYQKALQTSGGAVQLTLRKTNGRLALLKTKLAGGGDQKLLQLGIRYTIRPEGARIDAVAAKSPAAAVGLRRGDIIININGTRIRTTNDYNSALKKSFGYLQMIIRSAVTGRVTRVNVDLLGPGSIWR